MPHAGAMAPADALTYNSRWGGPSSYGYGVFGMYGMHVEAFGGGCDARLSRCDGSVYCFSSKAADGTYRYVPPGAPSELKRTATGWVEHEPGRNTYTYDNSGQVVSIQNPCGEIWTLTHSSPLSSIADPYGRLTTYVYDASSKLQRIVDVHGRSTTFVVDSNGNLTKRISPELCITELVYGTSYDDLHQLKAVIAPDGARTSLSYDTNGWCNGIIHPDGQRYTYTYLDWDTTEVTDPAGYVTTLIHDGTPSRNLGGGHRSAGQLHDATRGPTG